LGVEGRIVADAKSIIEQYLQVCVQAACWSTVLGGNLAAQVQMLKGDNAFG